MKARMRCAYDFHIHSCLSPCGDADMTPANLVGMAKVKGLDVIALTDHNSSRNCEAALAAGARLGVLVLPGMELCTAENIHVVCLFAALDGALAFAGEVYRALPDIGNRPEIFGEQQVMDENDRVVAHEEKLLLNAADIRIDRAASMAARFGGAAFPAHIDRPANGAIGVLGGFPAGAGFLSAELSKSCDETEFLRAHPETKGLAFLHDSDAHYLWDIAEPMHFIELPELTPEAVVESICTGAPSENS